MNIAIIGAMSIEVDTLRNAFSASDTGGEVYVSRRGDSTVTICRCGVGKVNAASLTQHLIDCFSPDCVINTGTAGALTDALPIGGIVVSRDAAYHDVRPVALLEDMYGDRFIRADGELVTLAESACRENSLPFLTGTIVSGDSFISTEEQREEIFREFPDSLCTEMEGAAIAHVCRKSNVPFVIIRAISDFASDEETFERFARKAADNAAIITEYIAGRLIGNTTEDNPIK